MINLFKESEISKPDKHINNFVRFTSVNFMALLIDDLNKEEFKSNTHDFVHFLYKVM